MIGDLRFRTTGGVGRLLIPIFQIMLVGYAVLILLPLLNMIFSSFKSTREIFQHPYGLPSEWLISNYRAVWVNGGFAAYFVNSVVITGISIALVLLFGSMAAFGIARYRYRLALFVYLLFLAGIMLPLKAAIIPLFLIIRRLGLMNTRLSLILVFTAMSLPATVFILTGFMRTIPRDLEDAARIDGANDFGIYRRVILPLATQSIALVTIYNSVPIWNDFFFPLVFIQSDRLKPLPLGMSVFFGQFQTNWGLLFAALSIAIIPMLVLYLFMSKYFIRGMTAGAIK